LPYGKSAEPTCPTCPTCLTKGSSDDDQYVLLLTQIEAGETVGHRPATPWPVRNGHGGEVAMKIRKLSKKEILSSASSTR
jgi:hypothetical protein